MTAREILATSPAGHPRGQWPAEELEREFRAAGVPVTLIADLDSDRFLIVREGDS